jgi:hypothetical protein
MKLHVHTQHTTGIELTSLWGSECSFKVIHHHHHLSPLFFFVFFVVLCVRACVFIISIIIKFKKENYFNSFRKHKEKGEKKYFFFFQIVSGSFFWVDFLKWETFCFFGERKRVQFRVVVSTLRRFCLHVNVYRSLHVVPSCVSFLAIFWNPLEKWRDHILFFRVK